jgi:hypothetical protein
VLEPRHISRAFSSSQRGVDLGQVRVERDAVSQLVTEAAAMLQGDLRSDGILRLCSPSKQADPWSGARSVSSDRARLGWR